MESRNPKRVKKDEAETSEVSVELVKFSYGELASATNNFRRDIIGEGGFGIVYRGTMWRTGQVVAIKKMNSSAGVQEERQFFTEVHVHDILKRHPNIAHLIGICSDGKEKLLVYEHLPSGSLDSHLHERETHIQPLNWDQRMMIAAGVASGLGHVHGKGIIHKDIKPSNILLGDEFQPKLSDFGLAQVVEGGTHDPNRVMGTAGYCAPECFETENLTTASDVYSFGIVLLELLTGRKASDPLGDQKNLIQWTRTILLRGGIMQVADPQLNSQFSDNAFCGAVKLAVLCGSGDANSRPKMEVVLTHINTLRNPPLSCNRFHWR